MRAFLLHSARGSTILSADTAWGSYLIEPADERGAGRGARQHLLHARLRRLAAAPPGIDDELKKRDADPWCGLQIIDLASGDIVQWIRLEGAVTELFDVAVLPGVRRPMAAGLLTDEIHHAITIEME